MKIPKLFKKAAALVMAAVTALSVLPATTAFAAGDIGTISFTHTYDSSGNAMRYNSSANIGGYTAGGTGNYKYRMYVDGETGFCIQPGVPLKTGNTLAKASSETWNALSANQKKAVGLALLYGYQGNRNNLTGSDDEKWLATQTLVWEFVTGCREATGSYKQTSTTVYSLHFGSNYANSGAKAAYDQIVSLLSEHNTIPSFMSGGKNDVTKELAYKDGKYSVTLTDKNGVLSDYSFTSSDANVSVSKDGNKLTISSKKAVSGSVRITATRNNVPTVSSSAKLIAYGDPNLQDLVTGVENADSVKAYINIETPTGTIALKKTSEDGVVAGISFHIKGDGFDKTVKTDENGNISVEGLFPATYTITEQSIDRYEPQQSQTVTLIGGKTTTVNFNNTLKRGSLEVVKTSEDNLVEGVKFHLYGTSLSGLPVDEYAVTDKNGLAKFENVLISGDTPYVVEEMDTAIRYVVPESQTAPIEWNKVTKRGFTNILKKFNVTVAKTDVETGNPQGDATLAGAVYGIYKGEELIDTYTTDENGQFTTKYYICGDDWSVREISPSEGYLLDETIHHVGAEPELYTVEHNRTSNDVNEQVIKGNIAIIKHTDNGDTQIETPEEGATFEVYLKSAGSYEAAKETERDMLTCDENGFAQTKDMPYGIYTVKQTSGWEGRELMKPFDVFVGKDGQTYRYLINNANFESYIKIVKKDAETGNTIPYAGAGFQIYDPNGELVTMTFTYPEVTTIDTFYTTADGDLITPQTLEYGKGYSIVEVQAPYGYVLNSEPVYFDVVQENSEEESGITLIEVVRSNMAQKGTVTVEKSGEVFSTVAGDKGLYQPIFSVSGLEGAVYEITAAEDIYTLDGTLRASKGEVVDTVTTGADGTAKSKELYLGKYEVKEITAPYGMVLNDEIHSVELVYAGQEVAVTETATGFVNERQKVEIDLVKSLAVDKAYGVGTNGEIFDVTFGLYAAEELTAADGNDTSEIVCYHGFQSFKHGEVTPEIAHEVGVKLAEKMWGDRFQVIVATHLNTECLHNHFVVNSVSFADGKHYHDNKKNLRLLRKRSDELCREYALSVIEHPSGKKKPYALYQAEKEGRPTRDNVARQAVDEAISKSFTLKDFDRQMAEMGYRVSFDPNRKYWTIIGKGWQRPKRLYKLGEDYTNERIVERIKENSYAVKFQRFSKPTKQVTVYRLKGSLKDAKKIGGLRGLYLHYCYKLGILPKKKQPNYARLHYFLKDDLMKMEAITQETRLLCRCHIDTTEQLCDYKRSLQSEIAELTEQRKGLYSQSRKAGGEEKEAVKARLSEITERMKFLRKEVRLCEGVEARSDTLKEKLKVIRADENRQQGKELRKDEHRRRSGGTNRADELGGI